MCEGLLRTHAPLVVCLLAIFASHSNEFALSQVYIWGGISGGHDLLHLKGTWKPHLGTFIPSTCLFLSTLVSASTAVAFQRAIRVKSHIMCRFPPAAPRTHPRHVSWRDTTQLMVIKVAYETEKFKWKFSPSCGPRQKTNRKIDPNWGGGLGGAQLNDVWDHGLG